MFRTALMPRSMTTVAGTALVVLLLAAPPVSAAPTDTVLAIPFAGLTNGPTGFTNSPSSTDITVRTDPDEPGITRFRCGAFLYCDFVVHWRNISTGASGAADLLCGPSRGSPRLAPGKWLPSSPRAVRPVTLAPPPRCYRALVLGSSLTWINASDDTRHVPSTVSASPTPAVRSSRQSRYSPVSCYRVRPMSPGLPKLV